MKCLLMGINYPDTDYELSGCVNDAENLAKVLVNSKACASKDVTILRNPTGQEIVSALLALANETKSTRIDHVFVSFSGHGTWMPDTNNDETDGRDECICPLTTKTRV